METSVSFGFRKVSEAEKRKLVDEHFDSIAAKYDWMNTVLSFGLHYVWKRTAVRMSGIKAGDIVLDVCGGTADLALLAADLVGTAGRVVVYDINRAMMRIGRAKVAASHLSERVSFVQGDAERISFPDSSFDAVMVGFGIRNFVHLQEGLKEMHRVLKKGGISRVWSFQGLTPRGSAHSTISILSSSCRWQAASWPEPAKLTPICRSQSDSFHFPMSSRQCSRT